MKNTDYCPFCGSTKINVDTKQRLYTYFGRSRINSVSASARCSHCFARGPLVSGKVIGYKNGDIPDKYASICTTKEDLKKQAIDAWNRRAYEDTIHSVTYKNAVRFGLVEPAPKKVVFYFEKMDAEVSNDA